MKVYQKIAQLLEARQNCQMSNNTEWEDKHTKSTEKIVDTYLPHGSGIDVGVILDFAKSTPEKIIFVTSYHHMDENGYYAGWSDHNVIVTPSLAFGINLKITGRDRNNIKDYLYDVFQDTLTQEIE